jgi:hypothetical protein
MHIQVNTDKNIAGQEAITQSIEEIFSRVLERFADQITRLEVHLSDEDSASKSGVADKRCLLEARLAGRDPVSVSDIALTVEQAANGAAKKMVSLLESELGKLGNY